MDIKEMKAWGISQSIAQVIENGFVFNEETGEVYFTSDDLDALQEAFETKMNGICGYIKYCKSKAESLKQRKKEIEESQKYYETKAENLNKYAHQLLVASGKDKLDTEDFRLSFRKSTASEVYDEKALRDYINSKEEYKDKYFKYKEPEVSKTELANAIKESKNEDGTYNLSIPGFRLVENKSLQIK